MKDFDSWNTLKKIVNDRNRISAKLGEVCWCNFGTNIGIEIDGKGPGFIRPGIVIKNISKESVLIAPLTTQKHTGNWYFDILIQGHIQQIMLNQIRPIDVKRVSVSIGEISESKVQEIIKAYISFVLNR